MTQKDIKQRNVLTFEDYLKKQDKLLKAVESEEDKIDYGQHTIVAEEPYVRHDSNVYRAAGIEFKKDIADTENIQKPGVDNEGTDSISAQHAKEAAEGKKEGGDKAATTSDKDAKKDAKKVADASALVANAK